MARSHHSPQLAQAFDGDAAALRVLPLEFLGCDHAPFAAAFAAFHRRRCAAAILARPSGLIM